MTAVSDKWLGRRLPSTGPRFTPLVPESFVEALQGVFTAQAVRAAIVDLNITVDNIDADTVLSIGAVGGGSATEIGTIAELRIEAEEFDSDGMSLGTVDIPNSRQQSTPAAAATDILQVATRAKYTRIDPSATQVVLRVVAADASGGTGWILDPATGVPGGAVHEVNRIS